MIIHTFMRKLTCWCGFAWYLFYIAEYIRSDCYTNLIFQRFSSKVTWWFVCKSNTIKSMATFITISVTFQSRQFISKSRLVIMSCACLEQIGFVYQTEFVVEAKSWFGGSSLVWHWFCRLSFWPKRKGLFLYANCSNRIRMKSFSFRSLPPLGIFEFFALTFSCWKCHALEIFQILAT